MTGIQAAVSIDHQVNGWCGSVPEGLQEQLMSAKEKEALGQGPKGPCVLEVLPIEIYGNGDFIARIGGFSQG